MLWDAHFKTLNQFDENMKTGLKLVQFIGEFRAKGMLFCKK